MFRTGLLLAVVPSAAGARLEEALWRIAQEKECGEWSWSGMCSDLATCAYQPSDNDQTLGASCRVRQCEGKGPVLTGTAFNNSFFGTFRNWGDLLDTCSPWVMPANDDELRQLFQYARQKGLKVRMVGASHTAGGMVATTQEENVLVVSLANYTSGEDFSMHEMPDGSHRVQVNAGWSLLDLYEKIRPMGYFLPAQTAAPFFSLAGIVANSVHGGSYLHGFIHGYVTRLDVMDANGTIRAFDNEYELRNWRNSFGLLGAILRVEFQLEKRDKLEMKAITGKMPSWSAEELWKMIKQTGEANLPVNTPNAVPKEGGTITGKAWNGEFWIDFLNGPSPLFAVYAQKANESAAEEGSGMPANLTDNYAALRTKMVDVPGHGKMPWGEAARKMGAPAKQMPDAVKPMFQGRVVQASNGMSKQAMMSVKGWIEDMRARFNDGFFLDSTPTVLEVSYFMKPETAFETMEAINKVQNKYAKQGSDFVFAVPGEFRFVNVQDTALLQPVPEGLWFNVQLLILPDFAKNVQAMYAALKEVEDVWIQLGGKPHLGKVFGLRGERGHIKPFSPEVLCEVYTAEQKTEFKKQMQRWDPKGLFAAGLGLELLKDC